MRKRITLTAGGILTLLAASLVISSLLGNQESFHGGKSLSRWVNLIGRRYWENPPSPQVRNRAEQAITGIGTNAITFLIEWICYEPTPSKAGEHIARALRRLPGAPHLELLERPISRPAYAIRAVGAEKAFWVLGAAASPAIPSLAHLASSSKDGDTQDRILNAMAGIGTPALPSMINLLTNSPEWGLQLYAFYAIISLGTNAEPAIPAILSCITNQGNGGAISMSAI